MNAKSLVIGNYVIVKSNGKIPDRLARITEIHKDGCFVEVFEFGNFESCDNFIEYSELKPIVLTDRILNMNGIKLGEKMVIKEDSYWLDDTIIHIERLGYIRGALEKNVYHVDLRHHETNIFEGGFLHTRLKVLYLHQLQNMFNLMGMKDLAAEFKISLDESDNEGVR